MRETIPACFTLRRDPAIGGWLVYHDERGYIGRLKRKSANGVRRLLWAAREAEVSEIRREMLADNDL